MNAYTYTWVNDKKSIRRGKRGGKVKNVCKIRGERGGGGGGFGSVLKYIYYIKNCRYIKNIFCPNCSEFTSIAEHRAHFLHCFPPGSWLHGLQEGDFYKLQFRELFHGIQNSHVIPLEMVGTDEVFFLIIEKTGRLYRLRAEGTMINRDHTFIITCVFTAGKGHSCCNNPPILTEKWIIRMSGQRIKKISYWKGK